jgi:hypothetical protein
MKQCTSSVLMVRPASFQYNEQTALSNDYQKKPNLSKKEVIEQAQKEFDAMVELLEEHGVNVLVIEDTVTPEKPDAIFPNNWISMHQNGDIYLYPMKTPNRSAERRPEIIKEIKEYFEVRHVHDWSENEKQGVALEGTGSIIFDHVHHKAYACLSPRTDEKLFRKLCKELQYEPIVFRAYKSNGAEQYHTNVVMCIGEEFVVICLDSITDKGERKEVLNSLKEDNFAIIEITQDQLENHFAGNMLNVYNNNIESILVMSERAFKSLTKEQIATIEKFAQIVAPKIDLIEEVGGGSARCMMAEIFLPELEEE